MAPPTTTPDSRIGETPLAAEDIPHLALPSDCLARSASDSEQSTAGLPSNSIDATPHYRAGKFRPQIALQMRFAIDSFTGPLNENTEPCRLTTRAIG
jgi:hypothetical protein